MFDWKAKGRGSGSTPLPQSTTQLKTPTAYIPRYDRFFRMCLCSLVGRVWCGPLLPVGNVLWIPQEADQSLEPQPQAQNPLLNPASLRRRILTLSRHQERIFHHSHERHRYTPFLLASSILHDTLVSCLAPSVYRQHALAFASALTRALA